MKQKVNNSMKSILWLFFNISFTSFVSFSQNHEMHDLQSNTDTIHDLLDSIRMTHSYSLNLPMSRNSSGTTWQPDASTIYGIMKMTKKWSFMLQGSIFVRYNYQDISKQTNRSDSLQDRFDAPNWIMIMGNRKIKKRGLFTFNSMFSGDVISMGKNGYPLLFQTGETYQEKALVDRQHPHDFVSSLSVGYTQMINPNVDIIGYIGFPGEPAIGPPAFMHRISSFNNPDAPLGHHWQDATHIVFGVSTLGIRYKNLKFETSCFTGREPDENRFDFDKPKFDSYSYRISSNPSKNISLQFSQAFIKSPEKLESDKDVIRTTASILHFKEFDNNSYLASAVVYGRNQIEKNRSENSLLVESNFQRKKMAIYSRYEIIQKNALDLQINQVNISELFLINVFTIGSSYSLLSVMYSNASIGVQGSISVTETKLNSIYGKHPLSFEIYLHLTPMRIMANNVKNHKHH